MAEPETADGGVTVRLERIEKILTTPTPPKYATTRPEDYRFVRKSFADQWDLNVSDLTFRINSLAELWREDHGGVWPRGTDLLGWDVAQNSIWTFASGASNLPATITLINDDGSEQRWFNNPVRGLIPVPAPIDAPFTEEALQARRGAVISAADLPSILAGLSPISQPRGGGGTGRKARSFDRRQLSEAATNRWRGLLLEEPEDAELDSLVSDYITEANAFWVRDSGSLDFDTFVTDRIRTQDRHAFLYGKKPEFQSEAEYMGGFRQTVSQFGLSSAGELRELESGASSGVGLAGFGERVSRTRESRLINQGSFSQRLAGSLAGSGLGGS